MLIVVFGSMSGNLFSAQEVSGVTGLTASIGIVAVGVAFLMISGEFDLSVGAVFAFAAVVFGKLISNYGFPPWAAFLTVVAIAVGIGLVDGMVGDRIPHPVVHRHARDAACPPGSRPRHLRREHDPRLRAQRVPLRDRRHDPAHDDRRPGALVRAS